MNWATPQRDSSTPIGGELGRQGVGVVNWNGQIWAAYLGTSAIDSQGDAYIYTAQTSGETTFSNKVQVTVGDGSTVAGYTNPALAVRDGKLYLAYINSNGTANFISTSDGVTWSYYINTCTRNVISSVSLAVYNGKVYMGLEDYYTHTLVLCEIGPTDQIDAVNAFTNIGINFNPGLGVFGNTLYIATESSDNSHQINLYSTLDGRNLNVTNFPGDQTSTSPSLAVHNGVLYLGFRTNDSNKKFLYKYSNDGVNFSGAFDPRWAQGGPPALVNGDNLPGPYNGHLFTFFSSNTAIPNYLCSSSAP